MPFPLAHPAGVLPFRRLCPRYLSFSALIIGSLSPDLGYFSGPFRLGDFSHRFLVGSFAFCLPAGLLLFLAFYLVRSRVVGILPAGCRQVLLPLSQQRIGSPLQIVFSLLLGAWTHLLFDSMTHLDGWLVQRFPILQNFAPIVGIYWFRNCDVLYAAFTFTGVLWLAVSYQYWLERTTTSPASAASMIYALFLAGSLLAVALASRGPHQLMGFVPAGIIAILLVIVFVLTTGNAFKRPTSQR
jgi:hypothetical protein